MYNVAIASTFRLNSEVFFMFIVSSLLYADSTTGKTSVYTVYEGHEIMFHVSTLLPYSEENKQQVGRILFMSIIILRL